VSLTIASTAEEALRAMASGAVPVAGGTDLVVGARRGEPLPEALVAIDRIPELRGVTAADRGVRIGSCVSHATLVTEPSIVATATALADGAALVGCPATRHLGTVGGNVMNASPAMDTGAPLVVLGAEVELRSTEGTRTLGISDLWVGPGQTSAAAYELCTAVRLPDPGARSGSAYLRLEYRRAMEIAVVGAAAFVRLDDEGDIVEVRCALTAVAPTIVEVGGLADRLGSAHEVAAATADAARETATPISDLRAGSAYRTHTIGVMARRAVLAAARRAGGEDIPVPLNRAEGVGAA